MPYTDMNQPWIYMYSPSWVHSKATLSDLCVLLFWLPWVFFAASQASAGGGERGLLSSCSSQSSPRCDVSCCKAQSLGAWTQELWLMGCAALQHVGPSQIWDQTRVCPALTGRFLSTAPPEKSQCVPAALLKFVRLRETPSTVARQAPVRGILQTRILQWVAMPSSRASSRPRDQTCLSCISCIGRNVPYH